MSNKEIKEYLIKSIEQAKQVLPEIINEYIIYNQWHFILGILLCISIIASCFFWLKKIIKKYEIEDFEDMIDEGNAIFPFVISSIALLTSLIYICANVYNLTMSIISPRIWLFDYLAS